MHRDKKPRGPFGGIVSNLEKVISKHYVLAPKDSSYIEYIVRTWNVDSLDVQLSKMKTLLTRLKPLPSKSTSVRTEYKSSAITQMIDMYNVDTILDVGGESGDIATQVAKELEVSNVYVLDPKATAKPGITVLSPSPQGAIPLGNGVIDLIILAQTLHHINHSKRLGLMKEVERVLSPNGVVVIQEHAFDRTASMQIFLEIMHNFWYVKGDEHPDPMYLMTITECEKLFTDVGLVPDNEAVPWATGQRMYWRAFSRGTMVVQQATSVEGFVPDNLYITWASPLSSKNTLCSYPNASTSKMLHITQALVDFWDRKAIHEITVVYVGSPVEVGLLSEFFPGIDWAIYSRRFGPVSPDIQERVAVHKRDFTDEDAKAWSMVPNVFFFSDSGMVQQQRWVEIMKPYQASLEMEPYDGSYLEGNIMLKSFAESLSARLIPTKPYTYRTYDGNKLRAAMSYHNEQRVDKQHMEYVMSTQTR